MAGDISCYWAPWFRTNFKDWERAPDEFDFTSWQVAHSRMLSEMRPGLKAASDSLYQESQATFYWERGTGLVVGGTPDLVTVDAASACVHDAKTGKPRTADGLQVRLYMRCLPEALPELFGGKEMSGRLVYEDGHTVEIPPSAIVGEFESHFQHFLGMLDTDVPPDRVPSRAECRFCNIGQRDCEDRMAQLPDLGLYTRDDGSDAG